MIFHRGFRLRTELYSQDFQQGILKATSIILNTIKTLDDYTEGPQPEKMIPNGKNVFLIRFKNYTYSKVSIKRPVLLNDPVWIFPKSLY